MKILKIGSIVKIGSIEGSTAKVGAKQNKNYTINGISSVPGFYDATDEKGSKVTLWDLSTTLNTAKFGVQRSGFMRMSYTTNFEVNATDYFDAPICIDEFKGEKITRIDVAAIKTATFDTPLCENVIYKGQLIESLNFGSVNQ